MIQFVDKNIDLQQDAVIIKPTTQPSVTLDVEIYTSEALEPIPLELTTSQNATVLVVESSVKVSSVSGSSPTGSSSNLPFSSPNAISSAAAFRNTIGVLSTGLLLALMSKNNK